MTSRPPGFYTERVLDDRYLWTGGFFSERLPRPISPLGWTLLCDLMVPLALADPLRFLGVSRAAIPPLVKLYRGHPYTNVAAFQMLYAVFPDQLLPADVYRYFPGGDTALRRQVAYPRSIWHPRTFGSLALTFLRHWPAASPWHNWRTWRRFELLHDRTLAALQAQFDGLAVGPGRLARVWGLCQVAHWLDRKLLGLHRWSLTLADLTYTLLRRLLAAWSPKGSAADELAAGLVAGLFSYSLQMNAALGRLESGEMTLDVFLAIFGHRSFDLDIAHPTFADDPAPVRALAARLVRAGREALDLDARVASRVELERRVETGLRRWQRPLFRHLLGLAQRYMRLRENQRFVWQRSLAFQRRLFRDLGEHWAAAGALARPEHIWCATLDEVGAACAGEAPLPAGTIADRCTELARLEAEHARAPALTYPPFLQGDRPLPPAGRVSGLCFKGLPVSPGIGRGPARVVLSQEGFERVRPGDVLVTRGADPGWTPLFGLLAGLLLETGGQLSHGAVVAREYGLPAVAALPGITAQVADGQMVALDGRTGIVTVEAAGE